MSMHIGERLEEIQDALQRKLEDSEDDVLQNIYEEPTYKQDPNAEHNPLPTTEIVRAGIEEMIEEKVSHRVDEII